MEELKERLKPVLIVVGLSVVGLLFVVLLGSSGGSKQKVDDGILQTAVSVGDKARGKLDSKVVVTEFADFQCPACKTFSPVLQQLFDEYGDRVAFQYRHFPLLSIHPNANEAARAAQVAATEGKFWEMHDLLYERQSDWSKVSGSDAGEIFADYAEELDINRDSFVEAYNSEEIIGIVNSELDQANELRLEGTPTVFVNQKQSRSLSYQDIKDLIELELSAVSTDE
ncbi:thioredoxin domain-containing protein [Candidatus Dojkabacteria bacterium]|uniref:Thioredoxin domain-containing protein n=1 Tax=Candidatus Dojkabacteria bacterium TaxID=2099670 RepID=A0A955I2A7_9BACT|nr:thioredoxin domain-containing protein [Candidatus Dojkabacteria bacterium]